MLTKSMPDRRGCRGYPVSPAQRTYESRGQQADSRRLNVPPAAAKIPRRIPGSGIAARLTRYSRIVPTDTRYRVAVQPLLETLRDGITRGCDTGRKPSGTRKGHTLANAADDAITEPPDPAAARGKP
jgi:hypothetical protein